MSIEFYALLITIEILSFISGIVPFLGKTQYLYVTSVWLLWQIGNDQQKIAL